MHQRLGGESARLRAQEVKQKPERKFSLGAVCFHFHGNCPAPPPLFPPLPPFSPLSALCELATNHHLASMNSEESIKSFSQTGTWIKKMAFLSSLNISLFSDLLFFNFRLRVSPQKYIYKCVLNIYIYVCVLKLLIMRNYLLSLRMKDAWFFFTVISFYRDFCISLLFFHVVLHLI